MWSDQRVKRSRTHRFDAKQVRSEAREAARAYALQTKGQEHFDKVQKVKEITARRKGRKQWLQKVERGLQLQDREITSRKWLLRRGATTGSDFSPAERSELRRWFDALDTDGGGDIDLAELAAPLLSTGIASSIPQVRSIIEKNEIDEGGGLDFEAFQRLLKRGVHNNTDSRGSHQPDNGLAAMQSLRTHVEAANSNTGLNLDSRINATRRNILLDALKEIRHQNETKVSPRQLQQQLSTMFSTASHAGRRKGSSNAIEGQQQQQHLLSQAELDRKRLQNHRRRCQKAAKAQRKEDKMLALWRVVLGSKDNGVAGFHLGTLPPVAMDRGEVYAEWAEKVPRMHADSDVKRHEWQQVNHWMARSCDPNDRPRAVVGQEIETSASMVQAAKAMLQSSQSAPSFAGRELETDPAGGSGSSSRRQTTSDFMDEDAKKKDKLERMLSAYLRPTRADIARSRKMRERKKRGKKLPRAPPVTVMHELKPRQNPPYSIVKDEKYKMREMSVGLKRRKQVGVLG